MASHISQGPCPNPKCRSSDAYTTWPDGHSYCFSCHQYEPAHLSYSDIKVKTELRNYNESGKIAIDLSNYINIFPKHILEYIFKYELDIQDVQKNFMWDQQSERLVYVNKDEKGQPNFVSKRYMGSLPQRPKYVEDPRNSITKPIPIKYGLEKPIIIVEDIISALKLAKLNYNIVCLFGSSLANWWSHDLRSIYLWLDYDKRVSTIEYCLRNSNRIPVITLNDPKCYTLTEIEDILDKSY